MEIIILFLILIILILALLFGTTENCENFEFYNLPPFPVDVVYTWAGEKSNLNDARLSNNNELKYSIRSIIKFAPWVNKIYILMNPPKKKPSWFNDSYTNKIVLVDHYDTLDHKYLPTTNSNSIETSLVNIPDLSEHFIYFNDDFYLGNKVYYTDFFNKDGSKIIINSKIIKKCSDMKLYPNDKIKFNLPYYCGIADHIPFGLKKSIILKFQEEYPEYIEMVRKIKGRKTTGADMCQINLLKDWCQQQHAPLSKFAYDNNLGISKNINRLDKIYIEFKIDPYLRRLDVVRKFKPLFFCINDTPMENANFKEIFYNKVNNFLEEYYNEKPFFEN